MADDFEKAVLISFNCGGADAQLKVCSSSRQPPPPLLPRASEAAAPACRCLLTRARTATRIPTTQERAAGYIASIKQSPDCWRLAVERFGSTQYPEVKFWCLQTLHEVGGWVMRQQHSAAVTAAAG